MVALFERKNQRDRGERGDGRRESDRAPPRLHFFSLVTAPLSLITWVFAFEERRNSPEGALTDPVVKQYIKNKITNIKYLLSMHAIQSLSFAT